MKNKQKTLCEEVKHHDYEVIIHEGEIYIICKRCGDIKKLNK